MHAQPTQRKTRRGFIPSPPLSAPDQDAALAAWRGALEGGLTHVINSQGGLDELTLQGAEH